MSAGRRLAEERMFDAALAMIRAADNLCLLGQVAAARGDDPELWIGEGHLQAVRVARDALDHHGYFRLTTGRR